MPSASKCASLPRRPTMTTAPGIVPLSISRFSTSDSALSRAGDRPTLSGFAFGSGGVCRPFFFAAGFFTVAVRAIAVAPLLLDGRVNEAAEHRVHEIAL